MNNFILGYLLIFLGFTNCINSVQKNHIVVPKIETNKILVYSHNEYKLTLYFFGKNIEKFSLQNTINNTKITEKPELVTVDGEIPEGTNRIDYNNPKDFIGYPCDSTYQFVSAKINIAFALERTSGKRLDLSIWKSEIVDFKIGDFTLLKETQISN